MGRSFLRILMSAGLFSLVSLLGVSSPIEGLEGHKGVGEAKSVEDMAKECEGHLEKIKDAGSVLPADKKTEFGYHLEIAAVEVKILKDPNHEGSKRHAHSCHRHLKQAEHIVQRYEHHLAREKEREERQRKMEERKAKAEERRAKAAARKAERDAAKTKREAEKVEKATARHPRKHGKDTLDHGRLEGENPDAPGKDAEQPLEQNG